MKKQFLELVGLTVAAVILLTACAIFGEKVETLNIDLFHENVTFIRNVDNGKCFEIRVTEIDCRDVPGHLLVDAEGGKQ